LHIANLFTSKNSILLPDNDLEKILKFLTILFSKSNYS
jgi:hypothetical protein